MNTQPISRNVRRLTKDCLISCIRTEKTGNHLESTTIPADNNPIRLAKVSVYSPFSSPHLYYAIRNSVASQAMARFRLHRFPHVCRLCLEPDITAGTMVPLTTVDNRLEGTIEDFIASCTFQIAEDKAHLLPRQICEPCLEMVRFYAAFRTKMMNVSLLMNALVELRFFNPKPMTDLFQTQQDSLQVLFKDLKICNSGGNVNAEELIDDFPQYEIASISVEENFSEEQHQVLEGPPKQEAANDLSKSLPEPQHQVKPPPEYDFLYDSESDEPPDVYVPPLDVEDLKQALANRKYRGKRYKKKIKCPKCNFSSHYLRAIQTHQLQHMKREAATYPCKEPDCPAGPFKTYKELARHRADHRLTICDECGARFKTAHYLKLHSRLHTKQQLYPCQYCKKMYTQLRLPNHIRQVHQHGYRFRCRTCGMQFKWKETWLVHERTHGVELLLPCDQCDSKFNSKQALTNHRREFHTGGIEACKYCSETFHNRGVLLDHVSKVHGINLLLECDICVEPFETQDQLDEHHERHRNPRELECGTCLVQYGGEDELQQHVCITYISHYICCTRDHRNRARYNQHQLVKHGIRTNVRVKPSKVVGERTTNKV